MPLGGSDFELSLLRREVKQLRIENDQLRAQLRLIGKGLGGVRTSLDRAAEVADQIAKAR